jgi:hypothetical protein
VAGDLAHDVRVGIIHPFGNEVLREVHANGELLEQVQDRTWLAKVTNALNQHWQKRNANKKNYPVNSSQNGHVTAN